MVTAGLASQPPLRSAATGEIEEAIAILADLVAFDTTSRNSNLELVAWVEAFLDRLGVEHERFPSPDGTKANLFATIRGANGATGRGLILSGHTDVVPVDGQIWDSDPFRLERRDGRLYGRGTADMKGFLACCLASAASFAERPLAQPIHFAFSYDEEVGCTGVRGMLDALAARGASFAGCIVGEPTSLEVVVGHKGGHRVAVTARGRSCHSSRTPDGVNAVEFAARLVAHIRDVADRFAREGTRDALYDVPHTTLQVGVFHGGTAPNIVPAEARFVYEIRAIATDDIKAIARGIEAHACDRLAPLMRAVDPTSGFDFEVLNDLPGLEAAPDHSFVTELKRLAARNAHAKVAYGTEGGLFAERLSIPTVVIGPASIAQAHGPDEFIEIGEIERCLAFLDRVGGAQEV